MDSGLLDELTARARALVPDGGRALLGIAGAPGAGKSTLAVALVERLRRAGVPVAHVPMDGFHLADEQLRQRGLLERKGAIETFDVHGYAALLERLRGELDHEVLAPDFDRTLEQAIAGAIAVRPDDRLVVTEGNYLLDDDPAWRRARAALAEVWFVDLDEDVRLDRLVRRHVEFGKSESAARDWVERVDQANARRILASKDTADLLITAPVR
jgi:pantothenate kinase